MTILERRKILKRQIDLSDEKTLEKIESIILSEKFVLPQFVLDDLKKSENQIDNGEFLTEEEAEKDFEEWLNEE